MADLTLILVGQVIEMRVAVGVIKRDKDGGKLRRRDEYVYVTALMKGETWGTSLPPSCGEEAVQLSLLYSDSSRICTNHSHFDGACRLLPLYSTPTEQFSNFLFRKFY